MKIRLLIIYLVLLLYPIQRAESMPVTLMIRLFKNIPKIKGYAINIYNLVDHVITVNNIIKEKTKSQNLISIENQKELNNQLSEQLKSFQKMSAAQNEKIDTLSQKIDLVSESLKQQNEEIKKLFIQFDAQFNEIKEIKRLIEVSQYAEFKAAIASFEVAFNILKEDPSAHPAEMANALVGFIKTETYLNDAMAQGQSISNEQLSTLYFYLINCYLYSKNIDNVKKYTSLLLKIPVEIEALDSVEKAINQKVADLKDEYKKNLGDSIRISKINKEIKKNKIDKANSSKYKEIYADKSSIILSYKDFAKSVLKDELKISENEILDMQNTNDYIEQKNGLELEIMYKLAYLYQRGLEKNE